MSSLANSTYKDITDLSPEIVVIPWGATEAHNYHLPYATDNILSESVALEASKLANKSGARSVVLPVIPFGVNTGQFDIDLCINLNPTTQLAVLKDIFHVMNLQNIRKVVIVNGHGGNNFKQIIRELHQYFPKIFVSAIDWWKVCSAEDYFDEPGDHAGELETSVVMHLRPELVRPLSEAGDGKSNKFKIKALNEGWVTTQRQWSSATNDTGVGNPKNSSAEKGKLFFVDVTKKIGQYFIDLSTSDIEDLYEK